MFDYGYANYYMLYMPTDISHPINMYNDYMSIRNKMPPSYNSPIRNSKTKESNPSILSQVKGKFTLLHAQHTSTPHITSDP